MCISLVVVQNEPKSQCQEQEQSPLKHRFTFTQCDQGRLKSVKDAIVNHFRHDRLDILICNAAIMRVPHALSENGLKIQFDINHMAHSLIVKYLLPLMLRTIERPNADMRLVMLSSQGHFTVPKGGVVSLALKTTQDDIEVAGGWVRYGQSKVTSVLFALELSRCYPQIISIPVHPDICYTDLAGQQSFWNKCLIYGTTPK